jgi:hypothetical protein
MAARNSPPRWQGAARAQRRTLLIGTLVLVAVIVGAVAGLLTAVARARDGGGLTAAGQHQHPPGPPQRQGGSEVVVNELPTMGRDCANSDHAQHHGDEDTPRCVATEMGEVATFAQGPQLLITDAPRRVRAGQPFTIKVSTRNLVRDRFPPAAEGGYLLERADLTADGLTRGHFHTACRTLSHGTEAAPDPEVPVDFFEATEDGDGGATPDLLEVTVTGGIPRRGLAQCAVWAGDGSHRIPMMASPRQIPPFDTVLLEVE